MTDAQMAQINQQFEHVNRQFEQVNQRFDQVDQRFDKVDGRLDQVDGRLDKVDGRLDRVDERLDSIDGRFDQVDGRLDRVDGQIAGLRKDVKDLQEDVATNSVILQRIDAEVHKRAIEQERHTHDLKLAIEQFQSLQKVMNTKLDIEREAVDQRLDPLELTVRDHTNQLGKHSRRLDRLEHE